MRLKRDRDVIRLAKHEGCTYNRFDFQRWTLPMKIDVKVDATANEKRRFLGQADVTPMIELVSIMLDSVMLVVVETRLQALLADGVDSEEQDGH